MIIKNLYSFLLFGSYFVSFWIYIKNIHLSWAILSYLLLIIFTISHKVFEIIRIFRLAIYPSYLSGCLNVILLLNPCVNWPVFANKLNKMWDLKGYRGSLNFFILIVPKELKLFFISNEDWLIIQQSFSEFHFVWFYSNFDI